MRNIGIDPHVINVLNNPLSATDPTGQDGGGSGIACVSAVAQGGANPVSDGWCAVAAIFDWKFFESLFGGPSFHGSLKPRPNAQPWDEHNIMYGPNIAGALGLPDAGCDFGACGGGIDYFQQGNAPSVSKAWSLAKAFGQVAWYSFLASQNPYNNIYNNTSPSSEWPLNGNDWPGSGLQDQVCSTGPFASKMNSNPAILKCCQAHDNCYTKYQCNYSSWLPGGLPGACRSECNATVVGCIGNAK